MPERGTSQYRNRLSPGVTMTTSFPSNLVFRTSFPGSNSIGFSVQALFLLLAAHVIHDLGLLMLLLRVDAEALAELRILLFLPFLVALAGSKAGLLGRAR